MQPFPEKHNIRLVGLDLDHTTLTEKKVLTARVRKAIMDCIEAGITVLPATGRALEAISPEVLAVPGVRYVLTTNGARVYDMQQNNKVLYSDCFDKEHALQIIKVCVENGYYHMVFMGGKVYTQIMDLEKMRTLYDDGTIEYLLRSREQIDDILSLVEQSDEEVEKIGMMFFDPKERERAKEIFLARDDCTVTSSDKNNIELNRPTTSKGDALLTLGEMLGLKREQVMAVGDSSNDLDMLRKVGFSVAVANASPRVLDVVDYVTASNEEDGVAVVLEKLMATMG